MVNWVKELFSKLISIDEFSKAQ